jgi:hypothetical protein
MLVAMTARCPRPAGMAGADDPMPSVPAPLAAATGAVTVAALAAALHVRAHLRMDEAIPIGIGSDALDAIPEALRPDGSPPLC